MLAPKYPVAQYLNEDKEVEKVHFSALTDLNKRAYLRGKDLVDEKGSVRLGIRYPQKKTPHFYRLSQRRDELDGGLNEGKDHESHKNNICTFLSGYNKYRFGFYERPWAEDKSKFGFEDVIKLNKKYEWTTEVAFGLISGKFIRFDILGKSLDSVELIDSYPYVAIEVVDSHFHSKEAFKILLSATKNIPLIVIYYFVSKSPYLNQTKCPDRKNGYPKVRLQYHIADGSLWFSNVRLEDEDDSFSPDSPDEYYEKIRERLYAKGYIRR